MSGCIERIARGNRPARGRRFRRMLKACAVATAFVVTTNARLIRGLWPPVFGLWSSAFGPDLRADDWPCWRGPNHNGISTEKGWTTDWPASGPKQLWKASVGTGFSSMAVVEGRVFTLGNRGEVETAYCFEAGTGKELWKFSYPCPLDPQYHEGGPGATPTVEAGRVYTFSKHGQLHCFDAASGRVIWRKALMDDFGFEKPRWGFASSPWIEGNLVVVNAGAAGAAFHKNDGEIVWKSDTSPAGYATPVGFDFEGKRSLLIFARKSLVAVSTADGKEEWRYPWLTKWDINATTPIISDGAVFISSFDRGCALLKLAPKPRPVWENKEMANHFNSCVLWKRCLYGVHGNTDQPGKDFRCLDVRTGNVQWRQEGFGLGSVLIADGKLIVLGEHGELAVAEANPGQFKALARAQVIGGKCWTVPVLANGLLFCRNAQGDLVCLDLRGAKGGFGE